MANRHLSRSIVLQTLFEYDFSIDKNISQQEILDRNIKEFGPGTEDISYMKDLFAGILKQQYIIDEVIEKAAPEWTIDKISAIDRNILRLGLYELLFGDRTQVPPKVAINEAIELAKSFSGETSRKFVNGVLGGVYKELGEPGKNEESKRKSRNSKATQNQLLVEKKAGAVVYAKHDGDIYFAFVHDIFSYWTLSKGDIKDGESEEDACLRKVKEEMGLDISIKELLGRYEYMGSHPEKGKISKRVAIFLAESIYKDIVLTKDTKGLNDARWFKMEEVSSLKMYDNMIEVLTKAIKILMV